MIEEIDISRALEQTVEAAWYNLKDRRPGWVGLMGMVAKKRGYEYKDFLELMESACVDLADEKNSYMPKLGNFLAYIRNGKIAASEKTMGDAVVAWQEIEDCEYCLRGQIHGLLFDTPEHADLHYFACGCIKGQEMPHTPIYIEKFEKIEQMRKQHGDKFLCDKTALYSGTDITMPAFKPYDSTVADNVPF